MGINLTCAGAGAADEGMLLTSVNPQLSLAHCFTDISSAHSDTDFIPSATITYTFTTITCTYFHGYSRCWMFCSSWPSARPVKTSFHPPLSLAHSFTDIPSAHPATDFIPSATITCTYFHRYSRCWMWCGCWLSARPAMTFHSIHHYHLHILHIYS